MVCRFPKRSFLEGESIPAYIWLNNTTDKEYNTTTCESASDVNIGVWSETGGRLASSAERRHIAPGTCTANALIHLKAHSCRLVSSDPLEKDFVIAPGGYRLGELPAYNIESWSSTSHGSQGSPLEMPKVDRALLFNVSDRSAIKDHATPLAVKPYVDEALVAAKVFGRVVRADTGAPIPAAEVFLGNGAPAVAVSDSSCCKAVTDSDGRFSITNLPDGQYTGAAFADGFVTGDYHCTPGPLSVCKDREQDVTSTSHLEMNFRLLPEAVVDGTVTTTDGRPVGAGLSVTAVPVALLHETSNGIYSTWSSGVTDSSGKFRLGKLPPASYLIRVRQEMGSRVPLKPSDVRYHEAWFGNVSAPQNAEPVALKEGEHRSDIRIAVHTETRYNIILWLDAPAGSPPPREYIVSMPDSSTTAIKQADGSYLIRNVSPGNYYLHVFAVGMAAKDSKSYTLEVDVSDGDTVKHATLGR